MVKNTPANAGDEGLIPGSSEDPLDKGMATHFGTLAWKIPLMKKLGRLQSMGLQRNYSNKRRVNNTLEYLFIKKMA